MIKNAISLLTFNQKSMDSFNCLVSHIQDSPTIDYKTLDHFLNGYTMNNEIVSYMCGRRNN